LVLATLLLADVSLAQPTQPTTPANQATPASQANQSQAEALFAEGRDLLEKGRFAEACPKLARSEDLSPAVGTLLNLGYCYEQLGKMRSAMDAYAEAETLALAANESKRASFAKERFSAVELRAPKLVIRVVPPEAPGLEIKRNGITIAKTDLDHPIAVDPQDYVISATAPGRTAWKGAIIVRADGATVTVLVPPLEDVAAAPSVRSKGPMHLGTKRLVAVGLGGLSALMLGAGVATALTAKSRYNDTGAHCDASGCDETGTSIQSGAASQGTVGTVLIGVAVLAGAGGAYLWFTGAENDPTARSVRLNASPFGAALDGRF
jgi:tetratricopeptide (TPR) repeat protein